MIARKLSHSGFSLVEVVLALGVVAFGLVAIIGVLPGGLTASHSSQGETRATQIARDIFAELEIQARQNPTSTTMNPAAYVDQQATFPEATPNPPVFITPIDLTKSNVQTWGADSDGNLQASYSPNLPYQVTITVSPNPAAFNTTYASTVTIRVAWQPIAQNYRDFTRIISRY